MVAFAQMDADAAFLQLRQRADDPLKFGMNRVRAAKPEIEKIAQNIKVVDRRVFPAEFRRIDNRPNPPRAQIGEKAQQLAVALVRGAFQVGVG